MSEAVLGHTQKKIEAPSSKIERSPVRSRPQEKLNLIQIEQGQKIKDVENRVAQLHAQDPDVGLSVEQQELAQLGQEQKLLDAAVSSVFKGDINTSQPQKKQQIIEKIKNLSPGVGVIGLGIVSDRLNLPYDVAVQILRYGPGAVLGALTGKILEPATLVTRKMGKNPQNIPKKGQKLLKVADMATGAFASTLPSVLGFAGAEASGVGILGPVAGATEDVATMAVTTMLSRKNQSISTSESPAMTNKGETKSTEPKDARKAEIVSKLKDNDRLPYEEKVRLFNDAIAHMKEQAEAYNVTLPEMSPSQVVLLSDEAFREIIIRETGEDTRKHFGDIYGTVLKDMGVVLLNETTINKLATEKQKDPMELVMQFGVHELWHNSDNSLWSPRSFSSDEFIQLAQQAGYPLESSLGFVEGFQDIVEGFTDVRTQETFKRMGKKMPDITYPGQVQVVDQLSRRIGLDTFYQAVATLDGAKAFASKLQEVYGDTDGKGALSYLTFRMAYDREQHSPEHMGRFGRKPEFDWTQRYFIDRVAPQKVG